MKKTVMLKKNYEFRYILTRGKCFRGNLIDIYIKNNHKKINMLGIAVSKKAGNSVKRNRIKRLIRENYKILENELETGNSIIILWKRQALFEDFDFYSIKDECTKIFIKAKLL